MLHDDKPEGTKDVAVIWGDNLKTNGFHNVEYANSETWVNWDCSKGFTLDPNCISNYHLITDSEHIRKLISKINIGDQIYIKGWLVNFHNFNIPGHGRKSYLSSVETGNSGSEVIFVKELNILAPGTPDWYKRFDFGWKGTVIILGMMILLSLARTSREAYKLKHKQVRTYPKIPK
jgi:hypothetical protein